MKFGEDTGELERIASTLGATSRSRSIVTTETALVGSVIASLQSVQNLFSFPVLRVKVNIKIYKIRILRGIRERFELGLSMKEDPKVKEFKKKVLWKILVYNGRN